MLSEMISVHSDTSLSNVSFEVTLGQFAVQGMVSFCFAQSKEVAKGRKESN
jgi:hypothetical protein